MAEKVKKTELSAVEKRAEYIKQIGSPITLKNKDSFEELVPSAVKQAAKNKRRIDDILKVHEDNTAMGLRTKFNVQTKPINKKRAAEIKEEFVKSVEARTKKYAEKKPKKEKLKKEWDIEI